jgi:hypothetical protein
MTHKYVGPRNNRSLWSSFRSTGLWETYIDVLEAEVVNRRKKEAILIFVSGKEAEVKRM